jgi:predicted Zn-dependent peptidase
MAENGRKQKPLTSEALPVHPDVHSGVLPNGLPYIILPNKSPPGRFEAHLQVFSGSADELEPQQGIAHLTEHVAYMGSRKRERLFGTGSQTNAYTDFHHTVFYAACPVQTPRGGAPMLPMALDALVDVMEARVETSRLEKERAAVLSEMTMVRSPFC